VPFNKSRGHALPRSASAGTRHAHGSSGADAGGPGERAEEVKPPVFSPGVLQGGPPVAGGGQGWGGLLPCASPSTASAPRSGDVQGHRLCLGKSWGSLLGKPHLLFLFLYYFLSMWIWLGLWEGCKTAPRCDPTWLVWGWTHGASPLWAPARGHASGTHCFCGIL